MFSLMGFFSTTVFCFVPVSHVCVFGGDGDILAAVSEYLLLHGWVVYDCFFFSLSFSFLSFCHLSPYRKSLIAYGFSPVFIL